MLALAALSTGGALGLAVGVAWLVTGFQVLASEAIVSLVVAAVLADGLHRRTASGRPNPPSIRRQVPQLWGRIFSPLTAALLYGARLGVGPLTVLNTWLWWAAVVIGASAGPASSALVGAAFGAVRAATMVLVAKGAERDMPARMAAIKAMEHHAGRAAGVVAAAIVGALLLGACDGAGDEGQARRGEAGVVTSASPRPGPDPEPSPLDVELAAALIDRPPAPGFDLRRAGPLDLAAAVALEPDRQAEEALLETRHFVRGFRRTWEKGAGPAEEVVGAFVYRFASPADASAYVVDGLLTIDGFGHQIFDIDDVPGAQGFAQVQEGADGARVTYGAVFARGHDVFLLLRSGPGSSLGPEAARELAASQADRA